MQGQLAVHAWVVELMYGEVVQAMELGRARTEPDVPTGPIGEPPRKADGENDRRICITA